LVAPTSDQLAKWGVSIRQRGGWTEGDHPKFSG